MCYFTNMLTIWVSMLLLSFPIFMCNVIIINVFNHIFVSEVILKTRIIKTKRSRSTFLNLILLSRCNYLRGFLLFDYNASWHCKMACGNWEFQWVLPIFSYKVWIKSVQYFSTIITSACVFLLILLMFLLMFLLIPNLNTILYFLLLSSVFTFSLSVIELLIYKILCLKINILLLYWTSQLYLSTNFIYMYVKYY